MSQMLGEKEQPMQGVRGDADRWARSAGHRGLAGAARMVRVVTAVVLLGSALLVVALVGQRPAAARPTPGDQHPILPERIPVQSARSGAADHDPNQAYLTDLVGAARALDPLAGPVLPPGVAAGAAGARSRPAGSDRLPQGGSAQITPRLDHALQREKVLPAEGAVVDDASDDDAWPEGEMLAAARSPSPRGGQKATPAPPTPTPAPVPAPAPAAPRSVVQVLDPVVDASSALALRALELASAHWSRQYIPQGSKPVMDRAQQAKELESAGKVPEARTQMDDTIAAFEGLISSTDTMGRRLSGPQFDGLQRAVTDGQATYAFMERRSRGLAALSGVVDYSNVPDQPQPAPSADTQGDMARAYGQKLLQEMELDAPHLVDEKARGLVDRIGMQAAMAGWYENPKSSAWFLPDFLVRWYWRSPELAKENADRAMNTYRGLVEHVGEKALLLGEQGRGLRVAAQEAAKVAADAKLQAERLKSTDTDDTKSPPKQGSLDDPETDPDSEHIRTADTEPATVESATVTPTLPSGVAGEQDGTPADATVAQTPTDHQPATLGQQAETRSEPASITTPSPVEVADTGRTPDDGGSLPADTTTARGDGATGTLVSDTTDTSSDDESAPSAYADVGVSDFDNGFFSSSLVA